MSDAELEEKRRVEILSAIAKQQVAREALLAIARLKPAQMRYFESPLVDPNILHEKLCDALALLVGGAIWAVRYISAAPQELKYVPFEAWDQWEQAQQRLEILKDVYPELELKIQMYRSPEGSEHKLFILWSEKVLQLRHQQAVN